MAEEALSKLGFYMGLTASTKFLQNDGQVKRKSVWNKVRKLS